ncbi:MAG: response regulator, partial [Verrucomicrobia bacterium]|nr:response regulator [Verrucomicrobiota bacterium]
IVKKMGLEPTTVSSGKEALRLLQQKPFGLVLTDLWMPEMNGAELAKAIRDLPGYQEVQILAITADVESRENFDMSPFDGILMKPVTQEQILQHMR